MKILLSAINSTFQHCSIGIRYLYANLAELQSESTIIEWTIKEDPKRIVESILSKKPQIFAIGVYIWNTSEIFQVCSLLKKIAPDIKIILGGPEISFETESQDLVGVCDYIIKGEADLEFAILCRKLLGSVESSVELLPQIIQAPLPEIKVLKLPYTYFSDDDIKNRIIYVEASRGCPYKCEYCLSSLDKQVRHFELDQFLIEIQGLIDRGARTFKFVDRTFNLSPKTSLSILGFFLERVHLNLFLHFELVPDRLPLEIRDLIQQFPKGSLQFEIGIQTLNPEVAQNVSRKNDLVKVAENFNFIKHQTHVHTHADLIVGLPGEDLQSFSQGFDRLWMWQPDEIQVGILKRLKGTPIIRHDQIFQMVYDLHPPFQILKTSKLSYFELQKMNRFSQFWDRIANSGEFPRFMQWLTRPASESENPSVFWNFFALSLFLTDQLQNSHSYSLLNLVEKLYGYIVLKTNDAPLAKDIIVSDYCHGLKRRDLPPFLKTFGQPNEMKKNSQNSGLNYARRQQNHEHELISLS